MSIPTKHMAAPAWGYHNDCPEGRIFDLKSPDDVVKIESEGWVDSPAKLGEAIDPPEGDGPKDLADMTKAELLDMALVIDADATAAMNKAEIIAAIEAKTSAAD